MVFYPLLHQLVGVRRRGEILKRFQIGGPGEVRSKPVVRLSDQQITAAVKPMGEGEDEAVGFRGTMISKELQMAHNFIPPLRKQMNAATEPAEAFLVYNRGIVIQMQTYIKNKDWTGLTDFVEALSSETETFIKSLLV